MKSQRRSAPVTPITFRDSGSQVISSSLPRDGFDKLDKICRTLGTTKSEFIREAVEAQLAKFNS